MLLYICCFCNIYAGCGTYIHAIHRIERAIPEQRNRFRDFTKFLVCGVYGQQRHQAWADLPVCSRNLVEILCSHGKDLEWHMCSYCNTFAVLKSYMHFHICWHFQHISTTTNIYVNSAWSPKGDFQCMSACAKVPSSPQEEPCEILANASVLLQ